MLMLPSVSTKLERYGILNDIHFPYEDQQRYKMALKIFRSFDAPIDHLYLLGDIGEFEAVSSWAKHPGEQMPFLRELEYVNRKLDEIHSLFPATPVTLIEGNHCYRLFRFIRDVAPQMWGLIDTPQVLKFHERPRWKFVPYGPIQLVQCGKSKLYLRHEPIGRGQAHAKQTAENAYVDVAYGHTHTWQSFSHRKFGPTPILTKAYSLGWLGDKSKPVFDYRGSKDNWVEGCTIVECETQSGDYSLEFVDLRRIPAFFRGKQVDPK